MRNARLRHALDAVILTATVGLIVTGILCLVSTSTGTAYSNLPSSGCSRPQAALTRQCFIMVPATVVHASVSQSNRFAPQLAQVTVHVAATVPSTFTVTISQPPAVFQYYQHHPNTAVRLKIWGARPMTIYYGSGSAVQAMRTVYNPIVQQTLDTWAGIALLGAAAMLIAGHPPLYLLPAGMRSRARSLPAHWEDPMGRPDDVFKYRPLRVALVLLVVLNLLDILTSVVGAHVGLSEGNPIANALVQVWGPIGGFFGLKLPAMIAVVLAASKLPRRLAVVVVAAGCVVMLYVVGDNLFQEVFPGPAPQTAISALHAAGGTTPTAVPVAHLGATISRLR